MILWSNYVMIADIYDRSLTLIDIGYKVYSIIYGHVTIVLYSFHLLLFWCFGKEKAPTQLSWFKIVHESIV